MLKTSKPPKSLILSAEQVRHLIQDKALQVRVPVDLRKSPAYTGHASRVQWAKPGETIWINHADPVGGGFVRRRCPLGAPGDTILIKQRWAHEADDCTNAQCGNPDHIWHEATEKDLSIFGDGFWRPAGHMPLWAVRLKPTIKSVRVERLNSIAEVDAIACGCQSHFCSPEDTASCKPGTPERKLAEVLEGGFLTAKFDFENYWNSRHGKKFPWSSNCWVWVIELEGP